MFSSQYTLYQKEPVLDHSNDGGPRCYYEFQYKKNRIILIGECHTELPPAIGKQYEYILNQFIDGSNNKTKIYIERKPNQTLAIRRTIINIFANMHKNDNVNIINADDRISCEGDGMFLLVLQMLLTSIYKKGTLFDFNIDKITLAWDKLTSMFKIKNINKLTLNDFEEILKIQLQKIGALIEKYENNNKELCTFLSNCHKKINETFQEFNQLKDEYTLFFPDVEYSCQSLDDVCIKMMNAQNSLEPAIRWNYVILPYITYSLDATLACRLSEEIHGHEDEQTLMVVVGAGHAENLATYFSTFCQTICSIPLKSKIEASIPPDQLQACLNGEVLNQKNTCHIM